MARINRMVRRFAGGAVLLLLAGLLTACAANTRVDACAWMRATATAAATGAAPQAGSGATVVLVDVSSSVRGSASSAQSPDYARAVARQIGDMVARRDVVSVGAFSGGQQITWSAAKVSTDWLFQNDNEPNQVERKQEAATCLTDDVTAAERSASSGGDTDVLAAMSSAVGLLSGVQGPRHLLVLTDGLPTTGCADLRSAGFATAQDATAIADVCAARQEVPQLTGVSTEFVGLGDSASDQPAATPAQRAWLSGLWRTLCARGHAERCATSATGGLFVHLPAASGGRPEPAIHYGTGKVSPYQLPAAALFEPDSSTIRPTADRTLNAIAANARTTPGSRLVVDGYVDPRGSAANDHQLSQARADAVRERLIAFGATNVTAYGRGVAADCSQPHGAGALTPDAMLQCQRRVDVELIRK